MPPRRGPPRAGLLMTHVNIHSKASEGSSATRGHWTVKTEILRRGGAPGPRPVPPSWGVGLGPRAGAGAGAAAGGTGAAAAPAGRGEGRVSKSSEEPGPRTLSSGVLLTWIWSGSRSGSRSGTVTWSRSQTTWRTLSWSARRSALGFWICSETVRVHCGERPGEPQTPPARAGADAPPPVRLTDNSTLSSHVTLAMGAAAPGTFTVGCFTQDPGKDHNSPPSPPLASGVTPPQACGPRGAACRLPQDGTMETVSPRGTRLSPVPLLLAFPPPGPHLCSEELVETVLLPAFAVRHRCPGAEPKSSHSGTFSCLTGPPLSLGIPSEDPARKALASTAAPRRRSQAEGPRMLPKPCVASLPFQAGVSLNS